jgi:hypothetical protein
MNIHDARVKRMPPADSAKRATVRKIDRGATETAARAERGDDGGCGSARG